MERQADRPTDKHACDSDISGFQEIGGLIKKKLHENERIRGFKALSVSGIPKISGPLTSMISKKN